MTVGNFFILVDRLKLFLGLAAAESFCQGLCMLRN